MKYIISGTNRPQSRSKQVSLIIQKLYQEQGEQVEIIDLAELPFQHLTGLQYGSDEIAPEWKTAIEKINHAEGLIMVVPEYNGSIPGALKYFIDHWKYPQSFENRPVCFVGLGGMFGGLRPVEHLQQVMAYRNAYQFPIRVFLMNIFKTLQNGQIQEPISAQLLKDQVVGFRKFVAALQSQKLDAVSVSQSR